MSLAVDRREKERVTADKTDEPYWGVLCQYYDIMEMDVESSPKKSKKYQYTPLSAIKLSN